MTQPEQFGHMEQREQQGHLTNEQLSAYLDRQVTPQEQAFFDAHLATCAQCREALAELRAAVLLLRAMPRPELSRSFVLPASFSDASNITPLPISIARQDSNGRTDRPSQSARSARVAHPTFRRAVRVMSTLAAVLGLLFVLSGLLTSVHLASGGATTASAPMYSSSTGASPARTPQASSNAATPGLSGTRTAQSLGNTEKTPAAQKTPEFKPVQPGTTTTPANQPALPPFLDLSTTEGRLSLGLVLAVLGIFGLFITRRRYRYR